jgi:hypothetical protein
MHVYIESLENAYSLTMTYMNRPAIAIGLPLAAPQCEKHQQQQQLYNNNNNNSTTTTTTTPQQQQQQQQQQTTTNE